MKNTFNFFQRNDILDFSLQEEHADFFQYNKKTKTQYCEMSHFENAFLCGIIKKYKPKKILEVGLAAGATTVMILDAIKKYTPDTTLYSVDLNEFYYRDHTKKSCFLAIEKYENNKNWHLKTGKYLPEVIELFGNNDYDMCIIDTVHALPGEILDYLVALPFVKNGGIFVFHDTHLHMYSSYSDYGVVGYATKVVLDTAVGEKIICKDTTRPTLLPNISAFIVNDDTRKYITNTFSAMSMPWFYEISDSEFSIYYNFYKKFYGDECSEYFSLARYLNTIRIKQRPRSIYIITVEIMKKYLPTYIYNILKKIKKLLFNICSRN